MGARVFVGLSGGVDSAVSAALLKAAGYDVVGVFIKIWRPEFIECTWKEDRLDALRVCAALAIPFREIDLSSEYKKNVVDPMLLDYAAGITPNPDVLCNRAIKFGAFSAWARVQGAERIATGHYARIRQEGAHYQLLRGADTEKDQSYFLYRLTQADLARTLFPVGDMVKKAVRAKARSLGLPVAEKHDSQGLCFVGDVSMPDFLRRYISVVRGNVLDMHGKVIGEHEGAALYTVGERHGFTVEGSDIAGVAHYVVRIDTARNEIVVSSARADAQTRSTALSEVHWIHHAPRDTELAVQARYRETPFAARIKHTRHGHVLESPEPHIFPPGQSLVAYQDDICLGGGIIRAVRHASSTDDTLSTVQPVEKSVVRVQ